MRRPNGVDALMYSTAAAPGQPHPDQRVLTCTTDLDGWSWPKAADVRGARSPASGLRAAVPLTPLGPYHPIWVEDPNSPTAHAPSSGPGRNLRARRADLRPPAGSRPPAVADLGIEGLRTAAASPWFTLLQRRAYSDGVGVLDMPRRVWITTPDEFPCCAPVGKPPLPSTRQRSLGWALRDPSFSRLGKDRAPTVRVVQTGCASERFAKDGDRRVPPHVRPLRTAGPVSVGCRAAGKASFVNRSRSPIRGEQDAGRHHQRRSVCGRCRSSPSGVAAPPTDDGGHDAARGHPRWPSAPNSRQLLSVDMSGWRADTTRSSGYDPPAAEAKALRLKDAGRRRGGRAALER